MGEFNLRADSVNVEQIMQQIRARIREKRGVDYTEQQIRELAAVKLERFLDPGSVRSDLLQHFRGGPRLDLPNYAFEDTTLFDSHRAPLRWLRRLLRPVLKLLFNPNPLIQALHIQSKVNAEMARSFQQHAELSYEVMHNLVVELTRLGIEARNLKMRVESLTSRLEFDERRARALEGAVQYKPQPAGAASEPGGDEGDDAEPARPSEGPESAPGDARSRARRRRRRGRRNAPRPRGPEGDQAGAPAAADQAADAQGGARPAESPDRPPEPPATAPPRGGAGGGETAGGQAEKGPEDRPGPGDQGQ